MSSEWKDKYFEEKFKNVTDAMKSLSSDIRVNTKLTQQVKEQAEATNGRVNRLEQAVYEQKPEAKDLPPFYRDPKVVQIGLYVSLALLLLVAAATRFDIKGLPL